MADEATPKPAGNGYDPDITTEFVKRIEALHGDLASERGDYMQRCKGIREDISTVFDEAKEKNIPKKALKKVIKIRALEAKAASERDDADQDVQDSIDAIRHALGDLDGTPLGAAAVAAA